MRVISSIRRLWGAALVIGCALPLSSFGECGETLLIWKRKRASLAGNLSPLTPLSEGAFFDAYSHIERIVRHRAQKYPESMREEFIEAAMDKVKLRFVEGRYDVAQYGTERAKIVTFFVTVAMNTMASEARKRRISNFEQNDEGETFDVQDPLDHDPIARMGRTEELELLREGLSQLDPNHRGILEFVDLGGGSIKEAAAHFGIPEGTAMSRGFNARKKLRRYLEDRMSVGAE